MRLNRLLSYMTLHSLIILSKALIFSIMMKKGSVLRVGLHGKGVEKLYNLGGPSAGVSLRGGPLIVSRMLLPSFVLFYPEIGGLKPPPPCHGGGE